MTPIDYNNPNDMWRHNGYDPYRGLRKEAYPRPLPSRMGEKIARIKRTMIREEAMAKEEI